MSNLTKCNNGTLFGVCCGIANFTGIDPSIVRILFVLGTLFTGSILFWIYLLLALILPRAD